MVMEKLFILYLSNSNNRNTFLHYNRETYAGIVLPCLVIILLKCIFAAEIILHSSQSEIRNS